jgi:hypothetical protein
MFTATAIKKAIKVEADYQFRNIIGSLLGDISNNNKTAKLNQGLYDFMENLIIDCLKGKSDEKWNLTIRVSLFFEVTTQTAKKVPDAIVVQCRMFEANNRLKYEKAEFFPNTDRGSVIEEKVKNCVGKKFIKPWNFAQTKFTVKT